MQFSRPFRPMKLGGVSLAVTNASGRVALPGPPTEVRLHTLPGDADCFVEFGDSTVTAVAATGMVIPAGNTEIFRPPLNATHVAAITAAGTATLSVHSGEGN